jgi:hypothetical protein
MPLSRDLGSSSEGDGIEIFEDPEGDLTGQDKEGVDTKELGNLVGEHGQLGGTTHGEDSLEDNSPPSVRR